MTATAAASPATPAETTRPVLELEGVGKVFPGSPAVEPVRGVTLTIIRGELVAVVGPSGSGKTTLLHLMAGLERPTSGVVRVAGQPLEALSDRRLAGLRAHRLGVVFQQCFLLEQVSALDNVATGLLYRGIAGAERRRLARLALDRVGLGQRLGHRPTALSGGERQRVAIARALAGQPEVVLADEPTGNLDSAATSDLVALLQQLNRQGVTLVVVTHDPLVAAVMGRRVQLRDGQVVADSGPGGGSP
jgi:putative ABC transport system ATP-binding protein